MYDSENKQKIKKGINDILEYLWCAYDEINDL